VLNFYLPLRFAIYPERTVVIFKLHGSTGLQVCLCSTSLCSSHPSLFPSSSAPPQLRLRLTTPRVHAPSRRTVKSKSDACPRPRFPHVNLARQHAVDEKITILGRGRGTVMRLMWWRISLLLFPKFYSSFLSLPVARNIGQCGPDLYSVSPPVYYCVQ